MRVRFGMWAGGIARELRPTLTLAGPVVLAELGWMAMGVVDTLFVGRLGPVAIGAVGLGTGLALGLTVAAALLCCWRPGSAWPVRWRDERPLGLRGGAGGQSGFRADCTQGPGLRVGGQTFLSVRDQEFRSARTDKNVCPPVEFPPRGDDGASTVRGRAPSRRRGMAA